MTFIVITMSVHLLRRFFMRNRVQNYIKISATVVSPYNYLIQYITYIFDNNYNNRVLKLIPLVFRILYSSWSS